MDQRYPPRMMTEETFADVLLRDMTSGGKLLLLVLLRVGLWILLVAMNEFLIQASAIIVGYGPANPPQVRSVISTVITLERLVVLLVILADIALWAAREILSIGAGLRGKLGRDGVR